MLSRRKARGKGPTRKGTAISNYLGYYLYLVLFSLQDKAEGQERNKMLVNIVELCL